MTKMLKLTMLGWLEDDGFATTGTEFIYLMVDKIIALGWDDENKRTIVRLTQALFEAEQLNMKVAKIDIIVIKEHPELVMFWINGGWRDGTQETEDR